MGVRALLRFRCTVLLLLLTTAAPSCGSEKARPGQDGTAEILIYRSSNLRSHQVAAEHLGGGKVTNRDVALRSLKAHAEVVSNPRRRKVYVNAVGHRKFVEKFPSGAPIRLGRYRYVAHVQLPRMPEADARLKTNAQAVHLMIQLWDGRNALYKSNKATMEGAIYWDLNPWTADEFGKVKVYTHPLKLTDTGIRLRPDTAWHRFEIVVDLEAGRYVSVAVDKHKADLRRRRLAPVSHPDWGRETALIITTESLAAWSKGGAKAFTWTTRFRDVRFSELRGEGGQSRNRETKNRADSASKREE
jgi:hypothetical protein